MSNVFYATECWDAPYGSGYEYDGYTACDECDNPIEGDKYTCNGYDYCEECAIDLYYTEKDGYDFINSDWVDANEYEDEMGVPPAEAYDTDVYDYVVDHLQDYLNWYESDRKVGKLVQS